MSMSKNTIKNVLMILGIIIFLAVYFLVYMDFSDKTDALNTEITTLNARLDQLNGYNEKAASLKSSIDENKTIISDALGKYYSAETPEDFIMFAVALEDTLGTGADVNTLSFKEPEPVYSIMAVKDSGDYTVPAEPMTLTGFKLSSTLDGTMSYPQMKTALDFINAQQDVTKLDSLNLNYDSATGLIFSSFVIDKYYITGRDIEEHQAVVPYTDFGKSVLIGS